MWYVAIGMRSGAVLSRRTPGSRACRGALSRAERRLAFSLSTLRGASRSVAQSHRWAVLLPPLTFHHVRHGAPVQANTRLSVVQESAFQLVNQVAATLAFAPYVAESVRALYLQNLIGFTADTDFAFATLLMQYKDKIGQVVRLRWPRLCAPGCSDGFLGPTSEAVRDRISCIK